MSASIFIAHLNIICIRFRVRGHTPYIDSILANAKKCVL